MNPDNGAIYAMASSPTYSPTGARAAVQRGSRRRLQEQAAPRPTTRRSRAPIRPARRSSRSAATAAYESGILAPGRSCDCPGSYVSTERHRQAEDGLPRLDAALDGADGPLEGARGLVRHVLLPARRRVLRPQPGQRVPELDPQARLRPGAAARRRRRPARPRPRPHVEGRARTGPARPPSRRSSSTWLPGDDINMSIGQGNLLVSPLQQAVAYSALENGGKVVTPHVGEAILQPGSTTQPIPGGVIDPRPVRQPEPAPRRCSTRSSRASTARRTPATARRRRPSASFQPTVYGKTGTAEVPTTTARTAPTPGGRGGRRRAATRSSSSRSSTTAATAASRPRRSRRACSRPSSTRRSHYVLHAGIGPVAVTHYLRHLDYLMLATVLSISAFGLWIMQTATKNYAGNLYGHQLRLRRRRAPSGC